MKKLTWQELIEKINEHNEANNIKSQFGDKNALKCRVVIKQETWPGKNYTEEQRTYEFTSDNKYFLGNMGGNSIYCDCLDGKDLGVRLDWYLGQWKIDYCYIVE